MENMVGQKFGRLTVIENTFKKKNKNGRDMYYVKCQCECGNIKNVDKYSLKSGTTKSCGCLLEDRYKAKELNRTIDLTGQRFGKLQIIEYAGTYHSESGAPKGAAWLCQCDCGNTKVLKGTALNNGKVKSCGCLRKTYDDKTIEKIKQILYENLNIDIISDTVTNEKIINIAVNYNGINIYSYKQTI